MVKPTNKLKLKLKSPLKFPKVSPHRRQINTYPDEKLSDFDTWREMCLLYEFHDSPHFDKYKEDIPQFKHTRNLPTYEHDHPQSTTPHKLLHRDISINMAKTQDPTTKPEPHTHQINDPLTDSLFTKHQTTPPTPPLANLMEICPHEVPLGINPDPMPLKSLTNSYFARPHTVICNKAAMLGTLLPHLKTTVQTPGSLHKVQSYILNDTGCTHSLTSKQWLDKHFPDATVQTISLDISTAGQVRHNSIIGFTDLSLTFYDTNEQPYTVTDTFYILSDLNTLELILGQSILGDPSVTVTQTPSNITFRNPQGTRQTIPFVRMDTKNQRTIQLNQTQLIKPPNDFPCYPITPLNEETIPPLSEASVICTLPDIAPVDAPYLHGKTAFLHSDTISPMQMDHAISTSETLTTLHTTEYSQIAFLTKLQNPTTEPIRVRPDNIVGNLTILEDTNEDTIPLQDYLQALPYLQTCSFEELTTLESILNEQESPHSHPHKPMRPPTPQPTIPGHNQSKYESQPNNTYNNSTYINCTRGTPDPGTQQCYHSHLSQPTILTVDDDSNLREPAIENKRKYTTKHTETFTTNLGTTELRPDIVDTDKQPPLTNEEFLKQFDLEHLKPETQIKFRNIFLLLRPVFATDPTDIGKTNLVTMNIPTPPNVFAHQRQRFMDSQKLNFLRPVIQTYLRKGIIRLADESRFASNLVLVLKPRKSSPADIDMINVESKQTLANQYRLTQDMRNLNNLTERFIFPLGNPEEIQTKCRGCLCTALDIQSAFTSMPIDDKDQHKTSFYAENQLYCWTRATQGLSNSPQVFSLLMSRIFSTEMSEQLHLLLGEELWPKKWITEDWSDIVSYYVDDILIHTKPTQEKPPGSSELEELHAEHVYRVLTAIRYAGLKVSSSKSDFAIKKFKLLGVEIDTDKDEISMATRRAQAILDLPKPSSLSDIQTFIAILSYWSRFLPRLRQICLPLSRQLKTKTFTWGHTENQVWHHLRQLVINRIVLTIHDPQLDIFIFSDASFWAAANILIQLGPEDNDFRIIGVNSKQFTDTELRTPIFNKECLAFIIALRHWSLTLYANETGVHVFCDASGITWFYRSRQFSSRFSLAANFISNFLNLPNFRICAIPGRHNCLADLFSRVFHTYSDQTKKRTFTISRARSKHLPPLQPYQTFDKQAIFHILTDHPHPESTDSGEKIARDTKNPFTLTEEITIHQNKYPEEIYMEFERFKAGFGSSHPKNNFPENSIACLNPTKVADDARKRAIQASKPKPPRKTTNHQKPESHQPDISQNNVDSTNILTLNNVETPSSMNIPPNMTHQHIHHIKNSPKQSPTNIHYCLMLTQFLRQYFKTFNQISNPLTKNRKDNHHQPRFNWHTHPPNLRKLNEITQLVSDFFQTTSKLTSTQLDICCTKNQYPNSLIENQQFANDLNILQTSTPHDNHTTLALLYPIIQYLSDPEYTFLSKTTLPTFETHLETTIQPPSTGVTIYLLTNIDHVDATTPSATGTEITLPMNVIIPPNSHQYLQTPIYVQTPPSTWLKLSLTNNPLIQVHWSQTPFTPPWRHTPMKLSLHNTGTQTYTATPTQPLRIKITTFSPQFTPTPIQHSIIHTNQHPPLFSPTPTNLRPPPATNIALQNVDQYREMDSYLHSLQETMDNIKGTIPYLNSNPYESPHTIPLPCGPPEYTNQYARTHKAQPYNLQNPPAPVIPSIYTLQPEKIITPEDPTSPTYKFINKTNLLLDSPSHKIHRRLHVYWMELNSLPPIPEGLEQEPETDTDFQSWSKHYLTNLNIPLDLDPAQLPALPTDQQRIVFRSTGMINRVLTREQLITLQNLDHHCTHTKDILSRTPKAEANGYSLYKGVLCHCTPTDPTARTTIVIPASIALDLYRTIHTHYGHPDKRKTKAIYNKFFRTPKFGADKIHRACLVCRVNKNLRPLPPPGDTRSLQSLIDAPRQSIFLDIADALKPSSSRRMKHVLIFIDGFSQFVQFAPLLDKKATTILRAYRQCWASPFGHPYVITTDNANSFLEEFKQCLVRNGVTTRTSLPHSQYQDLAEIGVKLLKTKLRQLLTDTEFLTKNKDWDLILPDIAQIINSQPFSLPFKHTREIIHFGNGLNHLSPLAFYAHKDKHPTPPVPTLADLGQFGPFTEYLTDTFQQTLTQRTDRHLTETIKRQRIHDQTPVKQGTHPSNIFRPGMLIFMTAKPKDQIQSGEPKRRLFRILASSPRGITAIDTQSFSMIRSHNFSSIEIPTYAEIQSLYPKEFFAEIQALSKDLYKRYHSTKTRLPDRLSTVLPDPSIIEQDKDQPPTPLLESPTDTHTTSLAPELDQDLPTTIPVKHNLRLRKPVQYPPK